MATPHITKDRFDAILFDLDGVITETAKVHAACWKRLFDDFLRDHARRTGRPFVPFDIVSDYNRYVDGKLREEGVASFLGSRGIHLPRDRSDATTGEITVEDLGGRKDGMVQIALREQGVEIFDDGVALVRRARAEGFGTAVVSSSKNCKGVLEAARIEDLFDVRVDGVTVAELGLNGKPAPDAFLGAAEMLGVSPARAVVVEDAISGVQAGRAGGFGLVVGVARKGDAAALGENGADVVVTDLTTLM